MTQSNRVRRNAALLALLLAAGVARAEPLTLARAVDDALAYSPALKQVEAGRAIAEEREAEARAGYLPRAEVGTTFTRGNNPVYVFGSLLEQERFTADRFAIDSLNDPGPENNVRTAATVAMPIFDRFRTDVAVSRAKLGREEAGALRVRAEQALRFHMVAAYYGLLLARESETVAKEAVKSAEADVARIRDLHETGMVVRSDLLAAEVQLAEFRQGEIEATGQVVVALAGLNSLLGEPSEAERELAGSLRPDPFDVPPVEELVAMALERRPELSSAAIAERSAAEGVRGAKSQYLPGVEAFATYGASGDTLDVDSTDWMVGARVSIALFDGGRGARVGQARAAETMAAAARTEAADRIRLEVIAANRRYLTARQRLTVARGAAEQAKEALRIVQDRYQEGLTTITEVLRAQSAELRARLGELSARYDIYQGYADLLRAAGALTDVEPFARREG